MPLLSNMEFNRMLIGGLAAGKKFASGTATADANGQVIVTGLDFQPAVIIMEIHVSTYYYLWIYNVNYGDNTPSQYTTSLPGGTALPTTYGIGTNSFSMTNSNLNGAIWKWYAYSV